MLSYRRRTTGKVRSSEAPRHDIANELSVRHLCGTTHACAKDLIKCRHPQATICGDGQYAVATCFAPAVVHLCRTRDEGARMCAALDRGCGPSCLGVHALTRIEAEQARIVLTPAT
jgi:hypothetical protein